MERLEEKQNSRLSFDEYFMNIAFHVSSRSTCQKLKVGAVLVKDNHIISTGYNGAPFSIEHCIDVGCNNVNNHCVQTVHAEQNAILQCAKFGVSTENTVIYVTHFPCLICAKMIIQAGIKEVCYFFDYKNDNIAVDMLKKANIKINKIFY
ncbi:MAG: cytidine/deoxycytidylate deaminase family protein [Ignavibacterium sp.]|nr:cytidine/deoxycytidylate deaminase family protein [Ignavibacterium sp.]